MSTNSAQTVESLLLKKGLIDQTQYDKLKKEQIQTGESFEDLALRDSLVSEMDLVKTKAEASGIPFIDPTQNSIKPEVVKLIPESTARTYTLMPIMATDTSLVVAMYDPTDLETIEFLERATKKRIEPRYSTKKLIESSMDSEYSKSFGKDVSVAIEEAAATSATRLKESLKDIDQAEQIIKVSPVAQIVSVILEYAVKSGASDIHIEPFENGTRIRYRIDGVLQEKFPLPKSIHNSIVARIKILANMKIDEHRRPLDGRFKVIVGDKSTDLRISTIPTAFGEKVVIRLLKDQSKIFSFAELGMWGKSKKTFEDALKLTQGIILVTGPTGSGKTVTQATALSRLNSTKVNIMTLEDPIEIHIPGVNQVQINEAAGLTFATGLRSFLRQDPNIIMVGEIRDGETAALAIQAALTGHLVFATLHTNSAAGAIPRLIDMGVENFLLSSTLNVSLAQRLARRSCTNCKEEYEPEQEIKDNIREVLGETLLRIGLGESPLGKEYDHEKDNVSKPRPDNTKMSTDDLLKNLKLHRCKGCEKCNNQKYKGRIGLYEIMKVDEKIQELTVKNVPTEEIQKQAQKEGMITLLQDGYLKVLWGITTLEEIMSVANT